MLHRTLKFWIIITVLSISFQAIGQKYPGFRTLTTRDSEWSRTIGWAFEELGDLNQDGYDDFAFGEAILDKSSDLRDGTTIQFGHSKGVIRDSALKFIHCELPTAAGDINGDGFSDVLLYLRNYKRPDSLILIYGAQVGIQAIQWDTIKYPGPAKPIGMRGLGDLNTDGYSDVMIFNKTKGTIFLGGKNGLTDSVFMEISRKGYGIAEISELGDLNGDNSLDLVIRYTDTVKNKEEIVSYNIQKQRMDTTGTVIRSGSFGDKAAKSLSIGGDLNNDGYADLAIGLPKSFNGRGSVLIYYGGVSGVDTSKNLLLRTKWSGNIEFGHDVAIVNDIDADRYDDLLVGAPKSSVVGVYKGGINLSKVPNAFLQAHSQSSRSSGSKVGSIGDFNGDGISDLIVSDPDWVPFWSFHFGALNLWFGVKNPYNYSDTTMSACDSFYDSYLDTTYTESTFVEMPITDINTRWTTLRKVQLTINQSTSDTTNIISCGPYDLGGGFLIKLNENGRYEAVFDSVVKSGLYHLLKWNEPNAFGCRDDDFYVIQIDTPSNDTFCEVACNAFTLPSGKKVTKTGAYIDTFEVNGRVNIYSYKIKIVKSSYSYYKYSGCNVTYTPWNERVTNTGIYRDTLINSVGCDSIIVADITILKPTNGKVELASCEPYIDPFGTVHDSTETFTIHWVNSQNCDSIIEVDYIRLQPTITILNERACKSYTSPLGIERYESGIYRDTFPGSRGCDSIFEIHLIIDSLEISQHPTDTSVEIGNPAVFATSVFPKGDLQWQSDRGFGFESLSNAGQYENVYSEELKVHDVNQLNHRQVFRCVIENGTCMDTTQTAMLTTLEVTGVRDYSKSSIITFPNPSTGVVNVQTRGNLYLRKVTITSSIGQQISVKEFEGLENSYQTSLNRGWYIINIELENGEIVNQKIVIH